MIRKNPTLPGDPLGESDALVAIQSVIGNKPGVQSAARALSHFGEHALGWMGLSAAGYAWAACRARRDQNPLHAGDHRRRKQLWANVGISAFVAHAASVIIKRVIRRPRPHDERIAIGVGTPSKLSFPSSHATSSTAALVSLVPATGSKLPLVGIPVMAASRLVLGVHYPSDVTLGSLIGLVSSKAVNSIVVKEPTRGARGVLKKMKKEKR